MPKTYYKVVSKNKKGKLYSALSDTLYSVEYKLGEKTLPHPDLPNSKLFVFDKLYEVRLFKKCQNGYAKARECSLLIYKINITNPSIIKRMVWSDALYNEKIRRFMIDLWALPNNKKFVHKLLYGGLFTYVGVDSVILREEITGENNG